MDTNSSELPSMQRTISPIDGSVWAEFPQAGEAEICAALARARASQANWRKTTVRERAECCRRFAEAATRRRDVLGLELSWQMGRPIRYAPREIDRMADRAVAMSNLAEESLASIELEPLNGFSRFIRREPLGVVFVIAPWNYPYLTAINSIVPAILAGNAVLLKPSSQTPRVAERLAEAFLEAGLPDGVFQFLHLGAVNAERVIASAEIDFVAFTGSVEVGRSVQKHASDRFIGLGLELGGKDPAYVRPDANLAHAIENLVDGSFFNSGQSCCGIERIYVHEDVFDPFVSGAVEETLRYKLGNPLDPETTLGPMVRGSAADFVRGQIDESVQQGARALIDESHFPASERGTPYLAPQILVNVDHTMRVMTEESFGPIVGIMKVKSDEEAIRLMNDSRFGLTASVWTQDLKVAFGIGERVETGTWFMNRCDYLDPELAWTGVKDSGRGCTLSRVGFEQLTRPKSFHLKTSI